MSCEERVCQLRRMTHVSLACYAASLEEDLKELRDAVLKILDDGLTDVIAAQVERMLRS